MPKLSMPGALLVGDAGGMVDTAALKGVHHCIKSGMLAAEAIYASLKHGESLERYEQAVEDSSIGKELYQVRNTRQPFQKGFIAGGPLANPTIMTKGKVPRGRLALAPQRRSEPLFVGDTRESYPKPDGKYTFDKLSTRLHQRQRHPRRRPQPHPRAQATCRARSPRAGAGCARPASTRSPTTRPRPGAVDVIVNYTNCVQCGAITAKGGRLTPPEGGDGPLYTDHLAAPAGQRQLPARRGVVKRACR